MSACTNTATRYLDDALTIADAGNHAQANVTAMVGIGYALIAIATAIEPTEQDTPKLTLAQQIGDVNECAGWLEQYLAGNGRSDWADRIFEAGKAQGYTVGALFAAANRLSTVKGLSVEREEIGRYGRSMWTLVYRCGQPRKDDRPCRTPVTAKGDTCTHHR